MLQGGNPYDTRRKSKENRCFLKKCCSVKIFWQYRYHLWTIIQIEDGSLRTQVPSGWKKWLLLWMESTNLTNYYTTCMAGKICPFPLYDQVVYLRIRARNDMKILALMEFSEYTLKVLLPRKVLSAEKRFSDVSLDLYISHASEALIFSEDTR